MNARRSTARWPPSSRSRAPSRPSTAPSRRRRGPEAVPPNADRKPEDGPRNRRANARRHEKPALSERARRFSVDRGRRLLLASRHVGCPPEVRREEKGSELARALKSGGGHA